MAVPTDLPNVDQPDRVLEVLGGAISDDDARAKYVIESGDPSPFYPPGPVSPPDYRIQLEDFRTDTGRVSTGRALTDHAESMQLPMDDSHVGGGLEVLPAPQADLLAANGDLEYTPLIARSDLALQPIEPEASAFHAS